MARLAHGYSGKSRQWSDLALMVVYQREGLKMRVHLIGILVLCGAAF